MKRALFSNHNVQFPPPYIRMSVKDRQGFGVDCLMRSHCRPQRASLAFLFGVVLGITLGCTATLTFVLHLERMTVSAGTSSMASLIPSHIRVENVKVSE